MSLKKDIISAEVQIGSNEAQKSLTDLTQKTSALTNENDRLRISQAKLKALGKESEEEYKKVSAAITENNKAIKENKSQMDALRKTIGLTEMSFPQLRKRASELRKELLDMGDSADPAQFNKLNSELVATERQMGKLRGRIGDTKKEINPLIDTAKQLLPAFSFAAIGSAAVSALNKIKNSTDTLSTQWDIFMGGMTSAADEFFRTLATGNWDNFIGNMQAAVRVGREYQSVLDELEAKQRALSIAESDAKEEIVRIEEDLKNKGLTNDQRLAAGNRRIQIEEELAVNRSKIAKQEYESELMMAKQASKLSDEKLQQLVRDFDSEKKIKAQALINLQDELRKLESISAQRGASTGVIFPGMVSTSGYSDAIDQVKQQIQGFSPEVASYASDLRLLGNVTDEQLNKMVAAYGNLKEAEVSGREGIKRVITMVNNLKAGEEDNGTKVNKAEKDRKKTDPFAIDPEKPIDNGWIIAQARADAEVFAEKKRTQEEWTAFLDKKVQEQIDIKNKELEFDKEIAAAQEELKAVRIDAIGQIAGALSGMFEQGSAAQIAFMAIEKASAIAQVIFQTSIANAKAVAMSPLTLGQPWVTINTISAGASIASIVAQTIGQFSKKGKQSGGFSNTGSDSDPDGIYHKNEFIGSGATVRNPSIRKVYNIIDLAQKQGTAERLNLPAVMASMGMLPAGRQSGGFGSAPPDTHSSSTTGTSTLDAATANRLASAIEKFTNKKWSIAVETVKNSLKELEEIDKNTGL